MGNGSEAMEQMRREMEKASRDIRCNLEASNTCAAHGTLAYGVSLLLDSACIRIESEQSAAKENRDTVRAVLVRMLPYIISGIALALAGWNIV